MQNSQILKHTVTTSCHETKFQECTNSVPGQPQLSVQTRIFSHKLNPVKGSQVAAADA